MAKPNAIEVRIEEARGFVASEYLEVSHALDGEERVNGDDHTISLFERTYLQGLVDMAVYLQGDGSIADLAKIVARERRQYRTGEIEIGILHIHEIGLDLSHAEVTEPIRPSRFRRMAGLIRG